MTDLDELLHAEGRRWQAGLQPPPLDPMVAIATQPAASRSRWAWPILAAVLLLAVPLITVLLRHSGHDVQPATPTPGPKLKLYGSVPWVRAVSQPDGHSVSVYAAVDQTPNKPCQLDYPVLQASTVETDNRITIRVLAYQPADFVEPTAAPGTALACDLVGHLPVPLLVSLGGPVAGRSLVDASTGQTYQPTQAADLPALANPPTGYLDTGSSPAQAPYQLRGVAQRSYRNGGRMLTLIRSPLGSQTEYPIRRVETTGRVLGQSAKVGTLEASNNGYRCAAWSDLSYGWQLCSIDLEPPPSDLLSAAELLTLANGVR